MTFTLKTALTTIEPPNVAIFLGTADAGREYEIHGKLVMHVEKTVWLDRLLVAFNGEAYNRHEYPTNEGRFKSEIGNIARTEFNIILSPTEFAPGNYDWPFQLKVPADVATTDCKRLQAGLIWGYELITLGEPSKPSRNSKLPKMVSIKDLKVKLSINLHPLGEKFMGVKKISFEGIQTEDIKFPYGNLVPGLRRFWTMQPTVLFSEDMTRPGIVITDPPYVMDKSSRILTKHAVISNPNKKAAIATWGSDSPIEYELEIELKHLIPTETVQWAGVTHGIRLAISFIDSSINIMSVTAPITFGNIVDNLSS
ncbi:hypothetical protein BGX26_009153 [Mortierella sp. AD094]|nr:hypothetical protein BGX26_009153 [Mortierella sp. AD094]